MCEDMCHIPRGSVMIDEAGICHDNETFHKKMWLNFVMMVKVAMMMALLMNEDQADSNAGPDKTDNHTTGWG